MWLACRHRCWRACTKRVRWPPSPDMCAAPMSSARSSTLELEHYPGMTEGSITQILEQAAERWPLLAASVVHRVGKLAMGDQIVWVGVASAHREAAFSACEFIMDYLKTRAPFWKKELGPEGEHWVSARQHDSSRAARWQEDNAL